MSFIAAGAALWLSLCAGGGMWPSWGFLSQALRPNTAMALMILSVISDFFMVFSFITMLTMD
jgi:hypothetical protein